MSMKSAYRSQKNFAKARGIEFLFEFEDWCSWWKTQLGPDWFIKRGCRRDQYVMARYKDQGAYVRGNIKCILSQDNHIEYNKRRKPSKGWSHPVLDRRDVRKIFLDERPYVVIADEFVVTTHQIQCIKSRKYFGKYTADLGQPGRSHAWMK